MMRRTLSLLALAAAAWPALAIAPAAAQDVLKIGYVGAQTGYLAPYDQPGLAGAEFAVQQINAAGGILGRIKVELISRDMRSESAEAARLTQELIDEGIQVLISPCDVDPSVAAGQLTQAAQIPTITSCASTPTLPGLVGDYMFSAYTADTLQAAVLADHAASQGYKTALILISKETPYTYRLPEYFAEAFTKKGGSLMGTLEFSMSQQDFSAEVTRIQAMEPKPDVIMTSAYEPQFPAFLTALRGAGLQIPVLGSDGIDSPTTLALGPIAEGVVFTNAGFATPGSPLEAFDKAFATATGKAPETVYVANGHDNVRIIEAAVIATQGDLSGPALRNAMDNLENVQGATGAITYKGQNRVPLRPVTLNRIVGGQKTFVTSLIPDAASVPAIRP